uniref:Photosystem I reaction center subunit XII n=1 Tax=Marsilea crenata TaxID=388472 RepID=S4UEV0_MARCR|nr:photosystem I reaction center subunit M [Marsilea crenata]AGI51499.1 photosystem I reaction center subunit M [Marsilea crenata]
MGSISDFQIILALIGAFVTSVLAARLAIALYR